MQNEPSYVVNIIYGNPVRTLTYVPESGTLRNFLRYGVFATPLNTVKQILYEMLPNLDPTYRILVFDLTGALVTVIADALTGSFEDIVNGGSGVGTLECPRRFVDIGWLNYGYRVQFYLNDSLDPWYDGRIIGYDQVQSDGTSDNETITLHIEGWSTQLANAIVSATLTPSAPSDGSNPQTVTLTELTTGHVPMNATVCNADTFLLFLLSTYMDASTFGPYNVASIPITLDKLQFDGQELNKCIDDIVKQVQDNTGRTYEWWCRGTQAGKPAIVIQPNQDPNTVASSYYTPSRVLSSAFILEYKDSTIYDYQIQNSSINLYNMIIVYGGQDPVTQFTVSGAFKDSTSISLYGLRQKKLTNSILLSKTSISHYATAYLLTNAYPQPQGTFRKVHPTDYARAGQWFQIQEPGLQSPDNEYVSGIDGKTMRNFVPQAIKQFRAVKVTCTFQNERLEQEVAISAPRPYIDQAYYAALHQSFNASATRRARSSKTQLASYFVQQGGNFLGSA